MTDIHERAEFDGRLRIPEVQDRTLVGDGRIPPELGLLFPLARAWSARNPASILSWSVSETSGRKPRLAIWFRSIRMAEAGASGGPPGPRETDGRLRTALVAATICDIPGTFAE